MKTDWCSVFNERETRSHKSKAKHSRKYVHTYALQVQVDMIMCFLLPLYYQTFMDHPKNYTIFFFYCMIMVKSKFYFPQPSYFERSGKNLNPNLSKEIGQFFYKNTHRCSKVATVGEQQIDRVSLRFDTKVCL